MKKELKSKGTVRILHLYPREMNIYGDWGNVLTIMQRLRWHGYTPELVEHHPGAQFPDDVDIVIGGGGQDSGQDRVADDLLKIGDKLHRLADDSVPMLMICGLYQLFGRFFEPRDGHRIQGIGIFDMETYAGPKRLIGNIVTLTDAFGEIVGYENHSGLTTRSRDQLPFGTVIRGAGNNGRDGTEGAVYHNVYGSYLHGSLLPKNPYFADELLAIAVKRRYGTFEPAVIDDRLAEQAREVAMHRPR